MKFKSVVFGLLLSLSVSNVRAGLLNIGGLLNLSTCGGLFQPPCPVSSAPYDVGSTPCTSSPSTTPYAPPPPPTTPYVPPPPPTTPYVPYPVTTPTLAYTCLCRA